MEELKQNLEPLRQSYGRGYKDANIKFKLIWPRYHQVYMRDGKFCFYSNIVGGCSQSWNIDKDLEMDELLEKIDRLEGIYDVEIDI